jgi:Domain of unknown function (DUF4878)
MRMTILSAGTLLLFLVSSCKSNDKDAAGKSENNIDAARNFIRAALDGKFAAARSFMLADSVNTNYMDLAERSYQRIDQSTKDGYRSSSINIVSVKEPVKDSVTIVIYSNSFKNDPDTLKVIKADGQWLVDFKYLYEHHADSLQQSKIAKDTIQ